VFGSVGSAASFSAVVSSRMLSSCSTMRAGSLRVAGIWTALLRYNGCVNGTNTRDCHRYPEKVRREVQRSARTICGGRDFDRCVVTPLRLGVRPAMRLD
jgi:hypothetical protein